MIYFIDQEFVEGFHKPVFGRNRHYIDLISIGIISEDNREYYAISNDFDLKKVWNTWQKKSTGKLDLPGINRSVEKEYWLRENVLKPIWEELEYKEYREDPNEIKQEFYEILDSLPEADRVAFYVKELLPHSIQCRFSYNEVKRLIKKYGKGNEHIAAEIIEFTRPYQSRYYSPETFATEIRPLHDIWGEETGMMLLDLFSSVPHPKFYGYFSAYDWVLFCSLFGRMVDLPPGFPMYCSDLKQMLDETLNNFDKVAALNSQIEAKYCVELYNMPFKERLEWIKKYIPSYPKQENEHNALSDAKWNKKLYEFILKM
jgi:hypothetical protein